MPTDDERILLGELRRIRARLQQVRDAVGDLHKEDRLSVEDHNRIVRLTRLPEDEG